MIIVLFRCVGNNEKETAKGVVFWTISLERKIGALTTEIKIMSREIAKKFLVQHEYPIQIPEDHELGGVFGGTITSEPKPAFETHEELVKRLTDEVMDMPRLANEPFDLDILINLVTDLVADEIATNLDDPAHDQGYPEIRPLVLAAAVRHEVDRILADCKERDADAGPEDFYIAIEIVFYPGKDTVPTPEQSEEIRRDVDIYLAAIEAREAGDEQAEA